MKYSEKSHERTTYYFRSACSRRWQCCSAEQYNTTKSNTIRVEPAPVGGRDRSSDVHLRRACAAGAADPDQSIYRVQSGSIWNNLDIGFNLDQSGYRIRSGPIWISGPIWTNLNIGSTLDQSEYRVQSGSIWKNLDQSGSIWTNLDISGSIWNNQDIEPNLDQSGYRVQSGSIWTNLDQSGPIWTNLAADQSTAAASCGSSWREFGGSLARVLGGSYGREFDGSSLREFLAGVLGGRSRREFSAGLAGGRRVNGGRGRGRRSRYCTTKLLNYTTLRYWHTAILYISIIL